ncbi:hypothetical protein [Streptomyces lavendulae]|uniref:hypothetical protein n=1 Tax=Streptomyces lavendulae TaxID=1914 RepID=UPI0031E77BA3
MSDEQQENPGADALHYKRADASKFPTTPAGQQAAVEGAAAASGWEIVKKVRAAKGAGRLESEPTSAAVLRDKMLALIEEHEAAQEIARAGHEAFHDIAELSERYTRATSETVREGIVADFADHVSLPAAGLIRRAAKALESVLPDLIVEHHIDGMSAAGIARELGYSHPTYPHKVIRDNPWDAVWILYVGGDTGNWEPAKTGTCTSTETAEDLAEQVLSGQLDDTLARRDVRLCVWREGDENERNPDFARAWCDREADTPYNH